MIFFLEILFLFSEKEPQVDSDSTSKYIRALQS